MFCQHREVGLVKNATKDIVVGIEKSEDKLVIKVFVTSAQKQLNVVLNCNDRVLSDEIIDLSPEHLYEKEIPSSGVDADALILIVNEPAGRELIRHETTTGEKKVIPSAAKPAHQPKAIENTEELFLTGQHLEQYRHAIYSPVPYYEEALKRDPRDIRNNNALGAWYLRRGQFVKSEPYFRKAIATSIQHNPNPYDGEPYYNLGLSLYYQDRMNQAYDAFFKAAWSSAWQDSAYFSIAQVDMLNKDYEKTLEHINGSLDRNARSGKAYFVKVNALRKLKRIEEAVAIATIALNMDKFNISVLYELYFCYLELKQEPKAKDIIDTLLKLSTGNSHTLIEYAIEYAALGSFAEAIELLLYTDKNNSGPMVNYYIGYYWHKAGDQDLSLSYLEKANRADPYCCFPNRLEDIAVLQYAQNINPEDARAPYYLGNLWYDKRQYDNAIASWEQASKLDDSFPTVFRNLAIAAYNKQKDPEKALTLFEKAFKLDPADARVLMELDQLYKRLNYTAEFRLSNLEKYRQIAEKRDDLYLEIVALHNFLGNYERAYSLLMDHIFHPWEGGEGRVSGQYVYSLIETAKLKIKNNQFREAIENLNRAQSYPHNLGEGKLYGALENDIFYWLGCAYTGLIDKENAILYWNKATMGLSEPGAAMFYNDQQPDKIFYQGLAWEKLGNRNSAEKVFTKLVKYGRAHKGDEIRIDYFAVSLPDLLIFEDDLKKRNYIHCKYITGLGLLGLKLFKEAKKIFDTVLKEDAMHFGAKTHLRLLETLNNLPV